MLIATTMYGLVVKSLGKMLYACAKFDVKICKYVVFVAKISVTYFLSNTSIHLSPQIKLWEGIGVEVKVKLWKILHSSLKLK